MNQAHARQSCTHCRGIILADTEDWEFPLCNECYEDLGSPANEPQIDYIKALKFLNYEN